MPKYQYRYQINDWLVKANENKLEREGKEISVEPRIIDLLCYLAENNGHVISRDELIEHIWKGAIVSDQVVTQSIFELRKILRDGRDDQQKYLATIPKRGYQLNANITKLPLPQQEPKIDSPLNQKSESVQDDEMNQFSSPTESQNLNEKKDDNTILPTNVATNTHHQKKTIQHNDSFLGLIKTELTFFYQLIHLNIKTSTRLMVFYLMLLFSY
ncbi:winged helix-turn-helix domain-containing protein [Vibrio sp. SS-MA-C1-2]|nr:winged helix-turn-helix domain-containing protein [Vibrio sp. SS-MA-C1-2]